METRLSNQLDVPPPRFLQSAMSVSNPWKSPGLAGEYLSVILLSLVYIFGLFNFQRFSQHSTLLNLDLNVSSGDRKTEISRTLI